MNEILKILHIILRKLNRIYAHLDVEWDDLSESELEDKYKNIKSIIIELNKQDMDRISKKEVKRM